MRFRGHLLHPQPPTFCGFHPSKLPKRTPRPQYLGPLGCGKLQAQAQIGGCPNGSTGSSRGKKMTFLKNDPSSAAACLLAACCLLAATAKPGRSTLDTKTPPLGQKPPRPPPHRPSQNPPSQAPHPPPPSWGLRPTVSWGVVGIHNRKVTPPRG